MRDEAEEGGTCLKRDHYVTQSRRESLTSYSIYEEVVGRKQYNVEHRAITSPTSRRKYMYVFGIDDRCR